MKTQRKTVIPALVARKCEHTLISSSELCVNYIDHLSRNLRRQQEIEEEQVRELNLVQTTRAAGQVRNQHTSVS